MAKRQAPESSQISMDSSLRSKRLKYFDGRTRQSDASKYVSEVSEVIGEPSMTKPETGKKESERKSEFGQSIVVEEKIGDIFNAPEYSVLVHACNCEGFWGAGIALAFKKRYPKAFAKYREHCNTSDKATLRGTAFLIPPCEVKGPKHLIGCVFTSGNNGRSKDSPPLILANTGPAMEKLLKQVAKLRKTREVAELRMCKINSGLFNVPWKFTRAVIENLRVEASKLLHQTYTVLAR
ncbi:ADP-ribose 1''-phosphate phosphatase [Cryomyces antarcticus]|uniref:ADP-ribose 1''-phosphate phosphatase n=1 Tax=Cryomyces antarcticus TaxID=329879 RepID=A0ABR0M7I0_9PEZI|nr:ADP-ribose 1''-phosphate phosphatase [Cryomyces antarcticus]